MSNGKKIIIDNNFIVQEDRRISFKELYTNEFYRYLNSVATDFNFGTIIDNVAFLYFFCPMLAFVFYMKVNEIEYVEIKRTDKFNKHIIVSAAYYLGIHCNVICTKLLRIGHFYNRIIIFLSTLYLLFFTSLEKFQPKENYNDCDVWIIRDEAERHKVYNRDKTIIYEEILIGRGNLYQNISRKDRLNNVVKSYRRAKREYKLINAILDKNKLTGLNSLILPYFAKRLTHVFYWGFSLETLILNGKVENVVISGNFCDAYAEVEKRVLKKHGKILKVFPHGLAYGFVFPNGYSGDVFYTMTKHSCDYLNWLYQTDKFVYDEVVVCNMLRNKTINQKKFVFFTDGTGNELDIAIILHLSKFLNQYKKKLYIKLHPHEKKVKYQGIENTDFICKIDEALYGNVCLSRGSTILIEAVHNNSVSVQTLIDDNNLLCKNIIPSLEDKCIIHITNYKDLDALIKNELIKERLEY